MNGDCTTDGIESEWIEAHSRLKTYLLALQLTDQEQQERILSNVLQHAALKHAHNPDQNPTDLAMNEMWEVLEQWLGKLLAPRERVVVTGLLSCFAFEATAKWPESFLADEVPAHFQHAMMACEVRAAPDLHQSSMVPLPFDNTLQDAMKLPTALGELTKNLSPSVLGKAAAFVVSGLTLLWTGKLR